MGLALFLKASHCASLFFVGKYEKRKRGINMKRNKPKDVLKSFAEIIVVLAMLFMSLYITFSEEFDWYNMISLIAASFVLLLTILTRQITKRNNKIEKDIDDIIEKRYRYAGYAKLKKTKISAINPPPSSLSVGPKRADLKKLSFHKVEYNNDAYNIDMMNKYHRINQNQMRIIFPLGLGIIGLGAIIIMGSFAVYFMSEEKDILVIFLGGIFGFFIDVIGALFIRMYVSTTVATNSFHEKLVMLTNIEKACRLIENISSEEMKDKAHSDLAIEIIKINKFSGVEKN